MYAPRAGAYRRAMRIRYGHITGWCTRCGCKDCAACGATSRQSDVVYLIGDQAVKEMQASLHELQRHYKPQLARRR
jgi:hypothetical protein